MARTTTVDLRELREEVVNAAKARDLSISAFVREACAAYMGAPHPDRHYLGSELDQRRISKRAGEIARAQIESQARVAEPEPEVKDEPITVSVEEAKLVLQEIGPPPRGWVMGHTLPNATGLSPMQVEIVLAGLVRSGAVLKGDSGKGECFALGPAMVKM